MRPRWLNPRDSTETPCGSLGGLLCWTVRGPAKDLFEQIADKIEWLLKDNVDETEAAQQNREAVGWFMYMTGRNTEEAVPLLLVDSPDRNTRATTVKIIKRSELWKRTMERHPALRLASSALGPQELAPEQNQRSVDVAMQQPDLIPVYSYGNTESLCGMRIFVNANIVTLGGVVLLGDIPFGLTVAHCSKQETVSRGEQYTVVSDEFSFEDESETEAELVTSFNDG